MVSLTKISHEYGSVDVRITLLAMIEKSRATWSQRKLEACRRAPSDNRSRREPSLVNSIHCRARSGSELTSIPVLSVNDRIPHAWDGESKRWECQLIRPR